MIWLPDGEKMKICLFVSTEYTNVTDGRTPHDGIGRAWVASRGKNVHQITFQFFGPKMY